MHGISFNVGDIVILKSGGPKMTVSYIEPHGDKGVVACTWIDDKGTVQEHDFKAVMLTEAATKPKIRALT